MKVQELLTKDTWVKGFVALSPKMESIEPHDNNAVFFCLWGAVERCYMPKNLVGYTEEMCTIETKIMRWLKDNGYSHKSVESFNDDPRITFENVQEVILALDL